MQHKIMQINGHLYQTFGILFLINGYIVLLLKQDK